VLVGIRSGKFSGEAWADRPIYSLMEEKQYEWVENEFNM
jgi:hypothetical protein